MSENQQLSWPGWETVGLIGHGNFGAVYEIRRKLGEIEEKAALKVIRLPQSQHDIDEMYSKGYDEEDVTTAFQSHLDSIISEYSLMRKMNGHTNIVSCDDIRYVQHDDGIGWDIFIKMELLTPLTKALPAQIDEQTTVKIAKDICSALVRCKKSNIIHRDVKPQNIFMSEFGDYKLGDFGIAKTVEKTSSGTMAGTVPFMAPEVAHFQSYGHSADIYSLGIVLYWLLNERRLPFMPLPPEKPKISMEQEAKERRLRGEPLPAPAHGGKALQAIVLKACAYDPAERYHTAEEMLQDLEKLGAKPAMPELVSAVALAPKAAPEVTAAPAQKPAPAPEQVAKADSAYEPMAKTAVAESAVKSSAYEPMAKAPAAQKAAAPVKQAATPEQDSAVKLSPAAESYRQHYQQHYEKPQEPAQKTREQIAEEYRRNYQAQQEKQEKAGSAPAESQKKMKLWLVFAAAAIVLLLLILLLAKGCGKQNTPNLPPHISSDNTSQNTQGQNQQQQAEVVSVSLVGAPTGRCSVGTTLDTANMVLRLNYSDGTTVNISDDFYICSPCQLNTPGEQEIIVSFQGHTAQFVVEVVDETGNTGNQSSQEPTQQQQGTQQQPVTLSSISVQSMPNKTQYYYGESLNTEGFSLKLTFSDGTTKTVTSGFGYGPARLDKVGDQRITVDYDDKQTSFVVTVKQDRLLHVAVDRMPNKTVFLRGEPFSAEGLMLLTEFESGLETIWDTPYNFTFYNSIPNMDQPGVYTICVGIDSNRSPYPAIMDTYTTYEIEVVDGLLLYIEDRTSYDVTLDRSHPSGTNASGEQYWKIPLPKCTVYTATNESFSYEWQLISWGTNGYNDPYIQGNSLIIRDKTLDSCYIVLRAVTYAYGYEYHSADVTYLVRFH